MVITHEIQPCAALRPFVRCYALRQFDTGGAPMIKPFHALHEFFLTFWLEGSPLMILEDGGKRRMYGPETQGISLQTLYKGYMHFSGRNRLFSIQFRPNGFYRIFGIPAAGLTDQVFSAADVLGRTFPLYHEKLAESTPDEMRLDTDQLLLQSLFRSRAKDPYDAMTLISSEIFRSGSIRPVKQMAIQANMSLSAFEHRFQQQVGVLPKMYLRLLRFNRALEQKMYQPETEWTDIACANGYYDQNHLVKEFRQFAGDAPLHFLRYSSPPLEHFVR